jgi:uncharacterized membrane protein YgcG
MRKLLYAAVGAGILTLAAGFHYAIPRVSTAQIVGVEVKRVDGDAVSRDVYMIQAQDPDTQRVRVFRNEDALIYLKLNSADVQAKATALSRGEALRTVAIQHYGWRIPMFSVFPNALSVREVEPGYRHVPIVGTLFLLVTLLIPAGLIWRVRKKKQKVISVGGSPSGPQARRTSATPSRADDAVMDSWLSSDDRRPGSGSADVSSGSGSDGSWSDGSGGSGGGGGSDV